MTAKQASSPVDSHDSGLVEASDRKTPSPSEYESFARLIENGVSVREVPKILSYFKVQTLWALGAFLLAVGVLGYNVYPWVNTRSAIEVSRVQPKHVNIAEMLLPSPAQVRYPFLVPLIAFLEDEADSEISNGQWKDSLPVVILTEPVREATSAFTIQVKAHGDDRVSGYAFRVFESGDKIQYAPLVTVDPDLVIEVPECNQNDRLMVVLRLSSKSEIPTSDEDLRGAIQLSVVGG
jgi:hypothetical protein